MSFLLGTTAGRYVLVVGLVAVVVGIVLLRIFNAGKAANAAEASAEALRRAIAANRARATVDKSKEGETHDPFNRDRR